MFRFIEYVFFIFYNALYLDGTNKFRKNPEWNAFFMFLAGTTIWLILFFEIFFFYVKKTNYPALPKFYLILLMLSLGIIFWWLLMKDKKYSKIYLEFKYDNIKKRKQQTIFAFIFYLILPFLTSMFIALKWQHKI